MSIVREHYVYIYLNPLKSGNYQYGKFNFKCEPFYVGIGKGNRINEHIYESKGKYGKFNKMKVNIILKILKNKLEPIRYKLYENTTIQSAKRLEIYLIKLIGRRDLKIGTLSNHTNGGDETPFYGKRHKKESIEKMLKTIGKSRKGELNANYGNSWSEDQKTQASKRQKENHKHLTGDNSPSKRQDVRKNISKSKMGLKNPNGKLWELVSPIGEKHVIEGGIKRNLRKYDLNYQQFKNCEVINGYRYNKVKKNKGWKLKKI